MMATNVKLMAVGYDGPYIVSDQPVAMIESGKRYGKAAGYQDFSGVTAAQVREMLSNWERAGKPEILIDHGTHRAVLAAGYITDMWIDTLPSGELRLMGLAKWTPSAAQDIAEGALPGFSIEIMENKKHVHSGVDMPGFSIPRAALVSNPFYDDLPRVSLECGILGSELEQSYRVALSAVAQKTGDAQMKAKITKLLGLADSVTDDDVMAKLTALVTDKTTAEERIATLDAAVKESATQLSALQGELAAAEKETGVKLSAMVATVKAGDKSGEVGVLRAQLSAVAETVTKLQAERDQLKTERLAKDCDVFIADGQKQGRIATKDDVVALWRGQFSADPDKARALLATIPPSSYLAGETGTGHGAADGDAGDVKLAATMKLNASVAQLAAKKQAENPKLSISDAQALAYAELAGKKK